MRELTSLGVRRGGGRIRAVGDLGTALDLPLVEGAVVVGLGVEGLVVAATVAAVHGRDLAFVRANRKDHGTGRILDGVPTDGRPLFAFSGDPGLPLLEHLPSTQVTGAVLLGGAAGAPPATLPPGTAAPEAALVDPRSRVHVLEGAFTTSSGFKVSRYVETLGPACTYAVAATFSKRMQPMLSEVESVCGIAHGGALLAAVAAVERGQVADLFWAPGADGRTEFHAPTCFLDDYIMIGATQRTACLAVGPEYRARSRFVAVYGPVPGVDFGEQHAEVLVVTEGGALPPPSPFSANGGAP